jgi:hypothetical protein
VPSSHSPIRTSRNITPAVKILLGVTSGGRCEFAGCNEYLFEHPLTLRDGNFSEHAHIVAFSEEGPRGRAGKRPRDINSASNLMLLCAPCHKLIDDHPDEYARAVLESYKQKHEERIKHVTGLGPDMRTSIVQLKATVGGSAVDIPAPHIYEAVAPRYPTDKQGHIIDLTSYGREDRAEYYRLATAEIGRRIARLYDAGMDVESTRHISLFALAPIPLLVFLGHCLSNKVQVDFFQRHRTVGEPWKWKTEGDQVHYTVRRRRTGANDVCVALVLSLSGTIDDRLLPSEIDADYSVYEITLQDRTPDPGFLNRREDLDNFRLTYRRFLAELMRDHPGIKELHVFPAVPAPVAVTCGHDLLPKVQPTLAVYDYDRMSGGFNNRLRINNHDTN